MPDYFQLKHGSFFEIGAVFVLASGSVEHLRRLQGGTALIDRRRFRPNLYLDTGSGPARFVEDEWLSRTLIVGDNIRLDQLEPTLWCVTSTLAQEELPRDPTVLRTAAQHHRGCLGVYGSVECPGLVRVGDPVMLLPVGTSASRSRLGPGLRLRSARAGFLRGCACHGLVGCPGSAFRSRAVIRSCRPRGRFPRTARAPPMPSSSIVEHEGVGGRRGRDAAQSSVGVLGHVCERFGGDEVCGRLDRGG